MDRWKSRGGKSQRREEKRREEKRREEKRREEWRREEKRREERSEEKESEERVKERRCRCAKGRKVAKHRAFFPMICGSGGSKSRLAKVAGAEPAGQMGDEKLHAVVARSTFSSQNVQNTSTADHFWKLICRKKCMPLWREARLEVKMYKAHQGRSTFWKLRCRKSARRCGAKQISKSTCAKHTMLGPLLEVDMSKKCTPLWHETRFEVKMYKARQPRNIFGS